MGKWSRRSLICAMIVGLLGAGRLAYADIPASVGWHTIADTDLLSVCPANNFGGSGYGFTDNCPNVTLAWSSGAWDESRNRLYVLGGGHADYYGNEVYMIDIDTNTRSRLTDPSLPIAGSCVESLTGPTGPNSRHTYGGVVFDDNADRLILVSGALACATANTSTGIWAFDPDTNTWESMGTFAALTSGFSANDIEGTNCAYDSNSTSVWCDTRIALFQYVYGTNTLTERNDQGGHYRAANMHGVVDRKAKKYHTIGNGQHWAWDISNPASVGNPVSRATNTCTSTTNPGLAWDEDHHQIVCWGTGNSIYRYNDDANTWTTVTETGGPTAVSNGTYGRFAYSHTAHAFITYNAMGDDLVALRVESATNADWYYRSSAVGVLVGEGFDDAADFTEASGGATGLYADCNAGITHASQDISTQRSGVSALKFTYTANAAVCANLVGSWRQPFGQSFSQNSHFYVQYALKIDAGWADNSTPHEAYGWNTMWKHSIMYRNISASSCASIELTTVNNTNFGTPDLFPLMYTDCGARTLQTGSNNSTYTAGTPNWYQSTSTVGSNGYSCEYSNESDGTGNGTGCLDLNNLRATWVTFYYDVAIGTYGSNNSIIKAYVAVNAGPYKQWLNMTNMSLDYDISTSDGYGQIDLTPYMTGLSRTASNTGSIWYDELIISTAPIPAPLNSGGGDTTPPAVPTGIYVTRRDPG